MILSLPRAILLTAKLRWQNLDSISSNLFRTPRMNTFNNLTQNVESSTTSSFICPHDLPLQLAIN